MRVSTVLLATLTLVACAEIPAGAAATLVVDAGSWTEVARDGDRALLRSAASETLPQTDERPTYAMALRTPAGSIAAPGPVLGGALVPGGAVWVMADGTLARDDGTTLDEHVIPELAVSADGARLAYPRAQIEGGGGRVLELRTSARRRVAMDLALADRPLFLPDGRLVVVGARASGIAGIWLVDASGARPSTPVTNDGLRTGRPLGPTFVPPPAYHASMHARGGDLVYDDGYGERHVTLPPAQAAPLSPAAGETEAR